MIVTCEKCFTRYAVPDDSVGVMGRTVKCAKCGYSWLQMQENPANVNTQATEMLPKVVPEEVKKSDKKIVPLIVPYEAPFYLKAVPVFACFMILVILALFYKDDIREKFVVADKIYSALHVYSNKGLALEEFKISFEPGVTADKENVYLEGHIRNNSDSPKHLPDLKISILNEKSEVIAYHIIEHNGIELKPQDSFPVENKMTNLTHLAKNIRLEFVDRIDKLF
jgi:predicted Zn finger-like uncharacterized protein